jgi:hypothetical protein
MFFKSLSCGVASTLRSIRRGLATQLQGHRFTLPGPVRGVNPLVPGSSGARSVGLSAPPARSPWRRREHYTPRNTPETGGYRTGVTAGQPRDPARPQRLNRSPGRRRYRRPPVVPSLCSTLDPGRLFPRHPAPASGRSAMGHTLGSSLRPNTWRVGQSMTGRQRHRGGPLPSAATARGFSMFNAQAGAGIPPGLTGPGRPSARTRRTVTIRVDSTPAPEAVFRSGQ